MFIDSISKHFLSFTNVTTLAILTINFAVELLEDLAIPLKNVGILA